LTQKIILLLKSKSVTHSVDVNVGFDNPIDSNLKRKQSEFARQTNNFSSYFSWIYAQSPLTTFSSQTMDWRIGKNAPAQSKGQFHQNIFEAFFARMG